jgi:hypothetical protein
MSMDGKEFDGEEEAGDDRKLWELLGRSAPVKASPYFSRRVINHLETSAPPRWVWAWPRLPGFPQAAGWGGAFAAIALALGLMLSPGASPVSHVPARAEIRSVAAAVAPAGIQDVSPQDIQVIADLDNQLAREETTVWTEDSTVF